jgi:hypothetical protein
VGVFLSRSALTCLLTLVAAALVRQTRPASPGRQAPRLHDQVTPTTRRHSPALSRSLCCADTPSARALWAAILCDFDPERPRFALDSPTAISLRRRYALGAPPTLWCRARHRTCLLSRHYPPPARLAKRSQGPFIARLHCAPSLTTPLPADLTSHPRHSPHPRVQTRRRQRGCHLQL